MSTHITPTGFCYATRLFNESPFRGDVILLLSLAHATDVTYGHYWKSTQKQYLQGQISNNRSFPGITSPRGYPSRISYFEEKKECFLCYFEGNSLIPKISEHFFSFTNWCFTVLNTTLDWSCWKLSDNVDLNQYETLTILRGRCLWRYKMATKAHWSISVTAIYVLALERVRFVTGSSVPMRLMSLFKATSVTARNYQKN